MVFHHRKLAIVLRINVVVNLRQFWNEKFGDVGSLVYRCAEMNHISKLDDSSDLFVDQAFARTSQEINGVLSVPRCKIILIKRLLNSSILHEIGV